MVYNWDGKQGECHRLYVDEKRSLDDVMEYWEQRGFTPSKRAFQTQFKRWDFPSKQNPAHKNPVLIARVQELWENNCSQKDMLDALQTEGFEINDRELMRVRLRFKWFLREPRGSKRKASGDKSMRKKQKSKQIRIVPGNDLIDQLANAILQDASSSEEATEDEMEGDSQPEVEVGEASTEVDAGTASQLLDPGEALRRQLRKQQAQAESDEKWRMRKRRRRTRGWGGLPADAAGEPPRFPSETTIDESKAYLSLDNKLYREMRDQFQAICEEQNVLKKTVAGPEKWAQLLQQLVRDNTHLANVFQQEPESLRQSDALWKPKNYKALSLDVICQDVTKRRRVMESRMGIPEAKTVLGLNPEQTRQVRTAFLAMLRADHFTSKFEAGDQHWNELKQRWASESEHLSRAINTATLSHNGEADPKAVERVRAIEVLACDVMKRLRAETSQKEPSRRKEAHHGPGPGPAAPSIAPHTFTQKRQRAANSNLPAVSAGAEFEIDPSLLLAASDAAVVPAGPPHTLVQQFAHPQHQLQPRMHRSLNNLGSQATGSTSYSYPTPVPFLQQAPLPLYFRLHPHSTTPLPNKTVWLDVLQTRTTGEVKSLAMQGHPSTMVVKLEGVVQMGDSEDREVVVAIDDDAELSAFLGHVGGGKATVVVLLGMNSDGGSVYV